MLKLKVLAPGFSFAGIILQGCAVPAFDVKHDRDGPTSRTVVERIVCELVDMLKSNDAGENGFRSFLLSGNYAVAMKLQLKVTDTGELAPSLSFPTVGPSLAIKTGFKLSSARSQTFFKYLNFSMRELDDRLNDKSAPNFGACPTGINHNLQGDLGISDFVRLDITSPSTATSSRVNKAEGEFGGTIEFTVIRNVNSAGPTWTFGDFEGPGSLAKLDRTSVNTLTVAFVRGSAAKNKKAKPTTADFNSARQILQEQLFSQGND